MIQQSKYEWFFRPRKSIKKKKNLLEKFNSENSWLTTPSYLTSHFRLKILGLKWIISHKFANTTLGRTGGPSAIHSKQADSSPWTAHYTFSERKQKGGGTKLETVPWSNCTLISLQREIWFWRRSATAWAKCESAMVSTFCYPVYSTRLWEVSERFSHPAPTRAATIS